MKSAIYAVIIIVMIGSCLVAITANNNVDEIRQDLEKERYDRMVAEEKLQKAGSRIKSAEDQLASSENKLKGIQAIVDENHSANDGLKSQLEEMAAANQALQKKVQDMEQPAQAAASGSSGKSMAY